MDLFLSIKKSFITFCLSLFYARQGATAIEYSLIAAAIAVAIVAIVFSMGGTLQQTFTDVNTEMTGGGSP
ncbi:MAG: Flp family type IVb pilin [Alphaproteobacteria bacterium]|nr:Flp family type IVb pilin [Alphaproteobacteria bacterium]